jgi:hypothetical protein
MVPYRQLDIRVTPGSHFDLEPSYPDLSFRGSWPNFKVLSRHSPGETEESHEKFNQDTRSPGRDLNTWSFEYEAGVLTTRPRSSVRVTVFTHEVKSSPSSSLALQPYVGLDLSKKLLPAKVSGYCFFRFRDKSLFQGGVVSPTPNPRLSRRANVFCQGCLP